jgi:hypothetical protein
MITIWNTPGIALPLANLTTLPYIPMPDRRGITASVGNSSGIIEIPWSLLKKPLHKNDILRKWD